MLALFIYFSATFNFIFEFSEDNKPYYMQNVDRAALPNRKIGLQSAPGKHVAGVRNVLVSDWCYVWCMRAWTNTTSMHQYHA